MGKKAESGRGGEKSTAARRKIDTSTLNLKRYKQREEDEEEEQAEEQPKSVSQGPVERIVDLTLNASREKLREYTVVSELQGRLFPLMDVMNGIFLECVEVATYRLSKDLYKKLYKQPMPRQGNVMDDLLYRTAQWQKSIKGKGLDRALDLALAETENRMENEFSSEGERGYEDS